MTKSTRSNTGFVIAYYFFDFTQKESLSACTFARSILHQVLCIESLTPDLQQRLERIFIGSNGTREPDIDDLETLIVELCDKQQKVAIIVDGISEVEQEDRRLVLRFFQAIQKSQAIIKLFVSGRPEVDVPRFFSEAQLTQIRIQVRDTRSEIDSFVESRVEQEAINGPLVVCGPAVIDKIKIALKTKARGM